VRIQVQVEQEIAPPVSPPQGNNPGGQNACAPLGPSFAAAGGGGASAVGGTNGSGATPGGVGGAGSANSHLQVQQRILCRWRGWRF
jgi:hypothetical protein